MVALHLNWGCVLSKKQNSKLSIKVQNEFNEGKKVFSTNSAGELDTRGQTKMTLPPTHSFYKN